MKSKKHVTEEELNKVIKKYLLERENEISLPLEAYNEPLNLGGNGFTSKDRKILNAIYDVIVKGGASGGYKSGRKRALTAIGSIPQLGESKNNKNEL
jgi:hypothetical protein